MSANHFRSIFTGILSVFALAACATSTPYGPASDQYSYGFSEQKIEDNRFRIMFKGNSLTERDTVENALLYRAAEVTVQNGYDYFIVIEDDTETRTTYSTMADPYYGRYRYRRFPYYGYGYRWDPYFGQYDTIERTRYTAIAYVQLGRGAKPADNPTAYDARQVIENLRSVVIPPQSS